MKRSSAIVGVADHCGWAVLVTAGTDSTLLDRRRVELVAPDLPKMPHHHEGQMLPTRQAVALVERVQKSAEDCAAECMKTLADTFPQIAGIALRACPKLPETIAERISSYHAQTRADGVMYREALAQAAAALGWAVHWYESRTVFDQAATALNGSIEKLLKQTGARAGRPWQKDHQTAMAAAIAARKAL